MGLKLLFAFINQMVGMALGYMLFNPTPHKSEPHFVVTEMVQCKGNICNAVLEMDDIAILIPYDSTNVHVGDTIYLVK
jgi:hypothetical protein